MGMNMISKVRPNLQSVGANCVFLFFKSLLLRETTTKTSELATDMLTITNHQTLTRSLTMWNEKAALTLSFVGGKPFYCPGRLPSFRTSSPDTHLCGYHRCTWILLFRQIETIQFRCVTLHLIQEKLKFQFGSIQVSRFYIYFVWKCGVLFVFILTVTSDKTSSFSYLFKEFWSTSDLS